MKLITLIFALLISGSVLAQDFMKISNPSQVHMPEVKVDNQFAEHFAFSYFIGFLGGVTGAAISDSENGSWWGAAIPVTIFSIVREHRGAKTPGGEWDWRDIGFNVLGGFVAAVTVKYAWRWLTQQRRPGYYRKRKRQLRNPTP